MKNISNLTYNSAVPTHSHSARRLRALVLGMGGFVPGFLFSLPFTMTAANLLAPADTHFGIGAVLLSVCCGGFTALLSCVRHPSEVDRGHTRQRHASESRAPISSPEAVAAEETAV